MIAGDPGTASVATRRERSRTLPRSCWNTTVPSRSIAGRQRQLAILVPEERGIGQPREDHALVALAHLFRIAALQVAVVMKQRHQRARAPHREIALMILQGGDQHLLGQAQEFADRSCR